MLSCRNLVLTWAKSERPARNSLARTSPPSRSPSRHCWRQREGEREQHHLKHRQAGDQRGRFKGFLHVQQLLSKCLHHIGLERNWPLAHQRCRPRCASSSPFRSRFRQLSPTPERTSAAPGVWRQAMAFRRGSRKDGRLRACLVSASSSAAGLARLSAWR